MVDVQPARRTPLSQQSVSLGTAESPLVAVLRHWLKPLLVVLCFWIALALANQKVSLYSFALSLSALLIAGQLLSPLDLRVRSAWQLIRGPLSRIVLEWAALVMLFAFLSLGLGFSGAISRQAVITWFLLTPVTLLLTQSLCSIDAARPNLSAGFYIIVGATSAGQELVRRIEQCADRSSFLGFFDFRAPSRLNKQVCAQRAGECHEIAAFVRQHGVTAVYIALPLSSAPRIKALLDALRDTTASIYFVPDFFAFETVHARCAALSGIPLLAICDTPFHGTAGLQKRALDLLLALLLLLPGWPLLLSIAVLVKCSSPGPVLFKQRRYGLDGRKITVYKFRSMTVCEDGASIEQAHVDDRRFTVVGRFLRRSSLDELPQIWNVLCGSMSFIGPRPHAIAHNEQYRKLISGYMIRHKVRPGISGWAQIHGLRGETSRVEDMRLRVQYDLEYMRRWSLWLDLKIILKTIVIVVGGRNAH